MGGFDVQGIFQMMRGQRAASVRKRTGQIHLVFLGSLAMERHWRMRSMADMRDDLGQ